MPFALHVREEVDEACPCWCQRRVERGDGGAEQRDDGCGAADDDFRGELFIEGRTHLPRRDDERHAVSWRRDGDGRRGGVADVEGPRDLVGEAA